MTVFISGATGLVGRLLLDALPGPVRALTRRPDRRDLPEHVEVVGEVDLRGVTAVFVHPRAVADLDGLVRAARAAGVGKVVALSAANVDEPLDAQPSRFRGDRNKEAEDAVVGSGLPWVSLRAASFASNTATAWAAQLARGDVVRGPYADFAEPLLHDRGIADVAAVALTTDALDHRRVTLTGPDLLTHREQVRLIGEALGRPLAYAETPADAAAENLLRAGLPQPFVTALLRRYAAGKPTDVTDEVRRALGKPARGFRDWLAEHADRFPAASPVTG
ncbi:NAD(P)H-binding protein [Actinokineospora soli]